MPKRPFTFIASVEAFQAKHPDMFRKPVCTMEGIAFQKDDIFGSQIEAIVQKYKDLVDAGLNQKAIASEKGLKTELEELVLRRLGLKVKLVTDSYLAATIPNVYVPHNSVINHDIRWLYEQLDNEVGQKQIRKLKDNVVLGNVNTETAKISGWFSQQTAPLFINFKTLFKSFDVTVPEVTAFILHELGHDWSAVEYSSAVNQTNRILSELARYISTDERKDVDYIYRNVKEVYPDATRDIAEGLASGNSVVMSIANYRLIVGTVNTLMFDKAYDRTTFEASSDNFAARFGYGLEIVTGLEKLEKKYPEYEGSKERFKAQLIVFSICAALTVLYTFIAYSGGAVAFLFLGPLLYLLIVVMALLVGAQRTAGKDMTYDNIRDRYMRVRAQMVELIKDPTVDREAKLAILDQIKTIDLIIANKRVFTSFVEKFFRKVSVVDRKAFASIEAQQEIEQMIANNVFVAANRLALKA